MTTTFEQLKSHLGTLPQAQRAELAHFLISTLEAEDEESDSIEEIPEAWRLEILRRVAEVENGTAVGRPVEEVLAEMRERYP